jgi:hypothetical protein
MSVAYFQEITGRDISKDIETNKRGRRTFVIRTTEPVDGSSVVLADLVARGFTFNSIYRYTDDSNPALPIEITDDSVVIVNVAVSQDNPNDPRDWRGVVEYAGVEDPTAQPAEVEYSPTRYQKALVKDVNDVPVVNSARDPFESGITVDRTRFTLTITKAVSTWDPVAAAAYQDTVNLNSFLDVVHPPGFPPGTCKLTLGAKRMRRKGNASFYWLRTATIDIDLEGWKVKVRDAGYREAVFDPGNPTVITGQKPIFVQPGVLASSPQLLKDGKWVKPPELPPDPLEFDGYWLEVWAPLGLEYGVDS